MPRLPETTIVVNARVQVMVRVVEWNSGSNASYSVESEFRGQYGGRHVYEECALSYQHAVDLYNQEVATHTGVAMINK